MICVIPFHRGDRELAQKLVHWMKELGDAPPLYLVRDSRAEPIDTSGLTVVKELVVTDDAWQRWPESPNWMLSKAGRDITDTPWLLVEPDCVPMKQGWFQALEQEWDKAQAAGKWFVGEKVQVDNVPVHCSGIAIYPPNVIAHAGLMLISHEIAWDVQAASQILPKLYETKLIRHNWKHPAINNKGELDNLRAQMPECVLFHADKAHSIIPLLRIERGHASGLSSANKDSATPTTAEINFPVPVLAESMKAEKAEELPVGSLMPVGEARESTSDTPESKTQRDSRRRGKHYFVDATVASGEATSRGAVVGGQPLLCDIFLKTYPVDHEWLNYCIRSIEKFATGFRHLVIAYDTHEPVLALPRMPRLTVDVGTQPDGYLWQQVIKLDADKYTDAPFICYLDSDTIFTKPVTPESYFRGGKVVWMLSPYEKVHTPWQQITEKFLKRPVAYEFMRRHPIVAPRWLLAELRAFCGREHGVTLDTYVMSQPHRAFSEFNVMGAFAYEFFRDEFVWVNTEEVPPEQWPVLTVQQFWSRGGLTPEIKQQIETILSGSVESGDSTLASENPRELARAYAGDAPPAQTLLGSGEAGTMADLAPATSQPLPFDLPAVPVLAEPCGCDSGAPDELVSEARESTESDETKGVEKSTSSQDSRGGGQTLSNGTDRASLVRDTVAVLKKLCTAPRFTNQVRKELKAQGIIKRV